MLYAAIFHSLGGAVAGSIFKIRTLLFLSSVVLFEAIATAFVDIQTAELWALINIVALQCGYMGGLFIRGALELAGFLVPPTEIRRDPLA